MSLRERFLIQRLRDRDERAFRELVELYQGLVFNVAFRMLGTRSEAEDLAQEVFVSVWKTIDQFRSESKLSTWLYAITANHCKNRIKYLSRRHERPGDAWERTAASDGSGAPDKLLEGQEVERIVQAAIASLEEDHRLVLVLRDLEELSYDEICTITSLPEGTVKSRLHRARLALKEKLSETSVRRQK